MTLISYLASSSTEWQISNISRFLHQQTNLFEVQNSQDFVFCRDLWRVYRVTLPVQCYHEKLSLNKTATSTSGSTFFKLWGYWKCYFPIGVEATVKWEKPSEWEATYLELRVLARKSCWKLSCFGVRENLIFWGVSPGYLYVKDCLSL